MEKLAKILLVDDDEATTFLNSRLLNRLAVAEQLLFAHNGEEALQTLEQMCSESDELVGSLLVLLDVNMPVMNGLQFLDAYQQHPLAQKCPAVIVMLTSSTHSRDLDRIKASPVAADIITKPLTSDKVQGILQRHFL